MLGKMPDDSVWVLVQMAIHEFRKRVGDTVARSLIRRVLLTDPEEDLGR